MPKLLKTPFAIDAAEGFRTDIQESAGAAPNSATYQVGFPPVTMQSIASNGMPPKGSDLNGVLYDITDNLVFLTQGGGYGFDSAYAASIGGYPLNARLRLTNGDIAKSTIDGNANDPNSNMTGWVNLGNKLKASSILDLLAVQNPRTGEVCGVESYHAGFNKGGGDFYYDSTKSSVNNGVTIFNGWVRDCNPISIDAFMAGAVAVGDHGSFLDHEGLRRLASYIEGQYAAGNKSFSVNFDTGDYIVQKELPITSEFMNTAEHSFRVADMPDLELNLNFNNANFVTRNGMRVGTFNRSDMSKYMGSAPFFGNAETVFFTPSAPLIVSNIKKLVMTGNSANNGNVQNHIVGGVYGDTGIQFASMGMYVVHIDEIDTNGIHLSHSHSNDGFYIAGRNPVGFIDDLNDGRYMNINGLVATQNGRNGISFTGGKNSSWYNCLSFNNGLDSHPTPTLPRSNLDIEAEVSPIRRARLYNFKSSQAGADGVVSALQDTRDVIFYDSIFINKIRSVWIERPAFKFYNCTFNGSMISGYHSDNEEDRTRFIECTFDESALIDPSVSTTRNFLVELNGKNPIFDECTFNIRHGNFMWSEPLNGKYPKFKDCTLNYYAQISDGMYGRYEFDGLRLNDLRPIPANALYLSISSSIFKDFTVHCEGQFSNIIIEGLNQFESYPISDNMFTQTLLSNSFASRRTSNIELVPKYTDTYFVSPSAYIRSIYADSISVLRKNTVSYNKGDTIHCTDPVGQGGIQKWVCTNAGIYNTTAWAASTAYSVNSFVNANGKVYKCTVAGTSGSTAPNHSSGTATDGSVTWLFVGGLSVFTSYS